MLGWLRATSSRWYCQAHEACKALPNFASLISAAEDVCLWSCRCRGTRRSTDCWTGAAPSSPRQHRWISAPLRAQKKARLWQEVTLQLAGLQDPVQWSLIWAPERFSDKTKAKTTFPEVFFKACSCPFDAVVNPKTASLPALLLFLLLLVLPLSLREKPWSTAILA